MAGASPNINRPFFNRRRNVHSLYSARFGIHLPSAYASVMQVSRKRAHAEGGSSSSGNSNSNSSSSSGNSNSNSNSSSSSGDSVSGGAPDGDAHDAISSKGDHCFMAYYISLTHVIACTLQMMACLRDKKVAKCLPFDLSMHLASLFKSNFPSPSSRSSAEQNEFSSGEWLHNLWDPHFGIPAFIQNVYPSAQIILLHAGIHQWPPPWCQVQPRAEQGPAAQPRAQGAVSSSPSSGGSGAVANCSDVNPGNASAVMAAAVGMRPAKNLVQLNIVCAAETYCRIARKPIDAAGPGPAQAKQRVSLQEYALHSPEIVYSMMAASESFMLDLSSSLLASRTASLFHINVAGKKRKKRRRDGPAAANDGSSDSGSD